MLTDTYKYAGLAAIAVEYSSLLYFLTIGNQKITVSYTVSDFGSFASTGLVFSLAFTLAGLLFGLFGVWLSRQMPLHKHFLTILGIGVLAQTAVSWLPNAGPTRPYHFVFASIIMIVMPLLVYYFSLSTPNRRIRQTAWLIVGIEVLAIPLLPLSSIWGMPLIAEGTTFVGFHLWVVVATFGTRAASDSEMAATH